MMKFDWRLSRAAAVLREGGVITHATEAVYGIAACAFEPAACARVAQLKSRIASQHFIVIGHSVEQLEALVHLKTPQHEVILGSWPGPHTWILPALADTPTWLCDAEGRLAVRLTAHQQAAELCRRVGPLISTSANVTGKAPARSLFKARRYFGPRIDCYLPGKVDAELQPSRISDGVTGAIVRA